MSTAEPSWGPREQELAQRFIAARVKLVRVAYGILGSRSEAEDVVSDVWLRLAAADAEEEVRDVEAWTTTTTARVALDAYRSARRRREVYVGPWLPEPLFDEPEGEDPADRVTLNDTVSFAVLVVLESLSAAERTAWVLHDVFAMPFPDVADVVGRSPQAVRQLAARARAHLRERAPRFTADTAAHHAVVTRFLQAAAGGDISALAAVLDPSVTLTSDGGGQVTAARRPVHGADSVARFLIGVVAKLGPDDGARVMTVNGFAGIGITTADQLTSVISLTVECDRITRVDVVRAPAKLHWTP